jgi:ABC-type uncharacterized transport system substrate-binding protein
MTRRTIGLLVTLALTFLAAAPLTDAQLPGKTIPRISYLLDGSPGDSVSLSVREAFEQGLRDLGWVVGQQLAIEYRYAEGKEERLPELAAELVRLPVDVIVVRIAPAVQAAMTREDADAFIVMPSILFGRAQRQLGEFAAKRQLPAIITVRAYLHDGLLMSYGPNMSSLYRRGAYYVDRILKGTKPGDLPVEQPTTFELVINLKTAQALGLTIPPTLLFQADEVIR